jgi:transcriptional regulator with XRE-family HTH domain
MQRRGQDTVKTASSTFAILLVQTNTTIITSAMSIVCYNFSMAKLDSRTVIAENLRKLRKKHGLTQAALAELCGVSKRMLAYYETKATKPSIQKIEAIAKALNVKIEELIGSIKNGKELLDDFSNIDSRTIKKFKQVLTLSKNERHMVYSFIDSLVDKKKKNQHKAS